MRDVSTSAGSRSKGSLLPSSDLFQDAKELWSILNAEDWAHQTCHATTDGGIFGHVCNYGASFASC
jgi:hypothetical protein